MMRRQRLGLATAGLVFLGAGGCDGAQEPELPRLEHLSIQLTPDAPLLFPDSARAGVVGTDQYGDPYPVEVVTWWSEDPAVATVDDRGWVHARGHGSARIVGSAEGVEAGRTIMVQGTRHREPVTESEVWAAAAGPHVVEGRLPVGGAVPVTLTIEAGTLVRFSPNSGLDVGVGGPGRLVADGRQARITMEPTQDGGWSTYWAGLSFRGDGRAELRHVTMSRCGGVTEAPGPCLAARDSGGVAAPVVLIDSVEIHDSRSAGIVMEGRSRFGAESRALGIFNARGIPAQISVGAAGGYPSGSTMAGHEANEIQLLGDLVDESATWSDPGVPWHVFRTIRVEGPGAPVLTIRGGQRFIFDYGAGFAVGMEAPGSMRLGEATGGWVRLFGEDSDWWGPVLIGPHAVATTIQRTRMTRCGGGMYPYGAGCLFIMGSGAVGPAPVLDSVTIYLADGAGIAAVGGGGFGPGSKDIEVSGAGVPLRLSAEAVHSLPTGRFLNNAYDAITIWGSEVRRSVTWRDAGVPYSVGEALSVEDASGPILTLEAGVVLRFREGGLLQVGRHAPGDLRAMGTGERPVLITSESSEPKAGFWQGVRIGELAGDQTELVHTIFEDAGAFDGQVGAAVAVGRDLGAFIRQSTIRRSADCGIARLGSDPWTTDFTAAELGNVFEAVTGATQCGP